jgi:transposase-like protein
MVVRIAGKRMYLWRAVDHEGEVLDMLVQSRRDSHAARPHMLLGVSRKRAMGCRGHEIAQGASRP